eukprot:3412314-Pleurochrysis_carterae.AAC.1
MSMVWTRLPAFDHAPGICYRTQLAVIRDSFHCVKGNRVGRLPLDTGMSVGRRCNRGCFRGTTAQTSVCTGIKKNRRQPDRDVSFNAFGDIIAAEALIATESSWRGGA